MPNLNSSYSDHIGSTALTQTMLEELFKHFSDQADQEAEIMLAWGERMRTDPQYARQVRAVWEVVGREVTPINPLITSPQIYAEIMRRVREKLA